MASCCICCKKLGFMDGGKEPYTGHDLLVCNDCGTKFKNIENVKETDTNTCKNRLDELAKSCVDSNAQKIIEEYSQKVLSECKMREIKAEENIVVELRKHNFKLTTGYSFDGFKIKEYLGVHSGETVLGTGFISEFSASLSDILGTQSNMFSKKMAQAKQEALDALISKALLLGANALIGIDFDYITFSNNILGVSANGTAVVIEKVEE